MNPVELVIHEARLLDEQRYDEWLALFTDDARYWVPMSAQQTDPVGAQSIACEDPMMLRIRIERLRSGKAYSHERPVASQHVLQMPAVESGADEVRTRTPFLYAEARGDEQLVLAGTLTHRLRATPAGLRIAEKRIDLLGAGGMLPAIFLLL